MNLMGLSSAFFPHALLGKEALQMYMETAKELLVWKRFLPLKKNMVMQR